MNFKFIHFIFALMLVFLVGEIQAQGSGNVSVALEYFYL
jgi:hypothetical protein